MKPKELTIRGLILGALITTVFTAANVYLGLKVGLTFASSIPAAVISMAVLSAVKDSTILGSSPSRPMTMIFLIAGSPPWQLGPQRPGPASPPLHPPAPRVPPGTSSRPRRTGAVSLTA